MLLIHTECKSCGSSLIKIKLFDKWYFDKNVLYGLAIGATVTISGFCIYKLWRFNKNLKNSINEITNLNRRLEYIILDLTHIDEARIGQTEKLLNKSVKPINTKNDTSKLYKFKKSSSSSVASMSDAYETPNTSPPSSSLESDENGEGFDDEFKDPIEDFSDNSSRFSLKSSLNNLNIVPLKSVLKKRKLDDDYHRLLGLPISDIKNMVQNAESDYSEDEKNIDKLVEYLKALFVLSNRIDGSADEIKKLQIKCYELAKKAVEVNSETFITHKWLAITIGALLNDMSINQKIKSSVEFKKHLEIAIELNDSDYFLLYMRGRFIYKLCNLNWAEKQGVKLVYGKFPNCSLEIALSDFLKVEELYPRKLKGNLLHIAMCFIGLKNHKKALEYLNEAFELPTNTRENELENQEIMSLIQKYS